MNPLKSRKQLLIAESELNRAELVQEWRAMAEEVHTLVEQARTVRSLAAAAAALVTGLASLRHKKPAPPSEKPSWWKTILNGAQVVGSFWSEFRARPK